jgi:hypothetical protein
MTTNDRTIEAAGARLYAPAASARCRPPRQRQLKLAAEFTSPDPL